MPAKDNDKKKVRNGKYAKEQEALNERYGGLLLKIERDNGVLWSACDGGLVANAINEVTRVGDSILFGRTRDGSALTICIMVGDDRVRNLSPYPIDMDTWLEKLIETLKASGDNE